MTLTTGPSPAVTTLAEEVVIQVSDLHKRYGKSSAVCGIDFEVSQGEIFGLIGPDGAGKTTTFHILAGVMEATQGDVQVLNRPPREARLNTAYLTQQFSLYLDLSIDENLRYSAGLREVPQAQFRERQSKYLKLMGLEKITNRVAGQLSGGMKQKLALCCALISQPRVLLLDEPTTGVDPVSRREFWDVLAALAHQGVTIVVATPYLDEAERCDRIALIYAGQIQQTGTLAQLRASLGLERLQVRTPALEAAEKLLLKASEKKSIGIADVQTFGDRLDVLVQNAQTGEAQVRQILSRHALPLEGIQAAEATLENVFVTRLRQQGSDPQFIPFPRSNKSSKFSVGVGVRPASSYGLRPGSANGAASPTLLPGGSGSSELDANFETQNSELSSVGEACAKQIAARGTIQNSVIAIAIGAGNLSKVFGDFQAVRSVTLEIRYGEIYGLLGANGAGKTTTIKMLCGLLEPSGGTISLAGQTRNLRSAKVRQRIGYMSQKFTLYDDLTVVQNLEFYSGVYGVPRQLRREKIDWVLEICGLNGQETMLTGQLPGGWKQRVAFGAAVMHGPEILFLDEPTSGVDPLARRQFWRLIEDFARQGTAVLVTTHYLEEAEHCNRMGFMVAGEVVTQGSPSQVKAEQPGQLFELVTAQTQAVSDLLKTRLEPWRVSIFGDRLHVVLDHPEAQSQVQSLLQAEQLQIHSLRPIPFSLEDVFIGIVSRAGTSHKRRGG